MIRNIVFDLGNVLLSFQPEEYLSQRWDEETARRLGEIVFASEEWPELDRGTLTMAQAKERFCQRNPELRREIEAVTGDWHQMLTPLESSIELARKLKEQGYRLFYLSNFHREAALHVREQVPMWYLFDGGIFSYAVRLLKPDREIYETLLRTYELRAEESVFIDDLENNVEAARELGFHGIVFEGADKCKTILDYLLAELPEEV